MASTNKTTNYELSQYVGSDKPSYLNDYNQDMSKIDLGIHAAKSEADTNATAIGDLTTLTTTAKTDLVSAINEVDSNADTANATAVQADGKATTNATAIGTLANLTTTVKTDLVSATNEVNGKVGNLSNLTTTEKSSTVGAINEILSQFNVGNPVTYDNSINPYSCDNGNVSYGNFTLVSNPMGSMAKIYGSVVHTPSTTNSSNITIGNSSLKPTTDIIINNAGFGISFSESATYTADLKIKTNGDIVLLIPGRPLNNLYFVFQPFLYFIKDFGDTNQ